MSLRLKWVLVSGINTSLCNVWSMAKTYQSQWIMCIYLFLPNKDHVNIVWGIVCVIDSQSPNIRGKINNTTHKMINHKTLKRFSSKINKGEFGCFRPEALEILLMSLNPSDFVNKWMKSHERRTIESSTDTFQMTSGANIDRLYFRCKNLILFLSHNSLWTNWAIRANLPWISIQELFPFFFNMFYQLTKIRTFGIGRFQLLLHPLGSLPLEVCGGRLLNLLGFEV